MSDSVSLSARRAWIEITMEEDMILEEQQSLSARRAWIEMIFLLFQLNLQRVALRKESVDRNVNLRVLDGSKSCRSPQGERG